MPSSPGMSRTVSTSSTKNRPSPLSSKSFVRYEPPANSSATGRNRASTVQSPVTVKSPRKDGRKDDVFEKKHEEDDEPVSPSLSKSTSLPEKFDELPIELASLTDRFIESLSAKIFSEPPTIDQLSDLFQEFYLRASSNISTHISTLQYRLNRDSSPTPPSSAAKARGLSRKQSNESLAPPEKPGGYQQMLTASEVTEKRKARKLLEYKRVLLEEAVERKVCERVYDKIWRHKSTLDEVRDEKLRSKTAALALVGIGLKDLGVEVDSESSKTLEDVQEALTPAREGLTRMTDEHFPLGKLQHLTNAHKAIVDTLYSIHPSSASADDILPTLIYSLITSPVEGINIISNLYFIQRFRSASKVDGEAAYCMTNLEAAISFLENVDLASLRADEVPEGPKKTTPSESSSTDEKLESFPKLAVTAPSPSTTTSSTIPSTLTATTLESPSTTTSQASLQSNVTRPTNRHNRTLSDLLQPITAAPETVRSTAEESLKTISSTLDNSFKFLFGKLRDHQTSSDPTSEDIILPKTLDEARQLVSRPLTPEGDEAITLSETSSVAGDSNHTSITSPSKLSQTEEKILNLIGGRRRAGSNLIRERSADSQRSTASGGSNSTNNNNNNSKRVVFAATGSFTDLNASTQKPATPTTSTSGATQTNNPLDSVKNFGATINPINHLASFSGAFRSFSSRATAPLPSPTKTLPLSSSSTTKAPFNQNNNNFSSTAPAEPSQEEISLRPPLPQELFLIKSAPPNARFLTLENAEDLTLKDVRELLLEFQRVARVLEGLKVVGEEDMSWRA